MAKKSKIALAFAFGIMGMNVAGAAENSFDAMVANHVAERLDVTLRGSSANEFSIAEPAVLTAQDRIRTGSITWSDVMTLKASQTKTIQPIVPMKHQVQKEVPLADAEREVRVIYSANAPVF